MSNTAELVWDDEISRFKAMYNGIKLCQSANKYRVIQLIEEGLCPKAVKYRVTSVNDSTEHLPASISVTSIPVAEPWKPSFSVNERFDFLTDFTNMVITRQSPSLLVTGDPKLGKSYVIEQCFKKAGLKQSFDTTDDTIAAGQPSGAKGDYYLMKGYSSPKALYRVLYEYRKRWLILDDCDKAITDPTAVLLLKAALDATEKRYVAWNSDPIGGSELPRQFEFEGGVIAITNLPMDKIDSAIKGRGNKVDLSMTVDEKLERIRHVMPHIKEKLEHVPMKERLEVFEWLKENASLCKELHFGTFISVCGQRHAYPDKWKRLAEYSVTA